METPDLSDVVVLPYEDPAEQLPSDEDGEINLAQREGTILPLEGEQSIKLTKESEEELVRMLVDICQAYDMSMGDRLKQWERVNDAYNMIPDPKRQGQKPDASRLVSEMTRSQVNIAASRITEGIMGVRPFMSVEVADDQAEDMDTSEAVLNAKAIEEWFDSYSHTELDAEGWIQLSVIRSAKLGDAVLRILWDKEKWSYFYLDKDGDVQEQCETKGKITAELIPNDQMIVWPLTQNNIEKMDVCGHRAYLTPMQLREYARTKKIDKDLVKKLIAEARAGGEEKSTETQEKDLRGKDIDTNVANPYKGQVELTELWCYCGIPGQEEKGPQRFTAVFNEGLERLLWIGNNTLRANRHCYFDLPYWREDGSFWSSGVGFECMYPQAADSALMNLLIDNLKIIANHLRIIKAGSQAEAMHDQIAPGYDLVTEDPQEDVRIEALGGDLSNIYQAIESFDRRKMNTTGITMPLGGMGDPVLKSGASPTSIGQLIEQAGKKFGQVDANIRRNLSQMMFFMLELAQQYAPEGLFYQSASQGTAERLSQMRFVPPKGDLRKLLRITARAPSAATSKEMLKQNLMLVLQQTMTYIQTLIQLAELTWGETNPAGLLKLKEDAMLYQHEVYAAVIEQIDVPGLTAKVPKLGPPTDYEQFMNDLIMQIQQLEQELEKVSQENAMLKGEEIAPEQGGPLAGNGGGAPMGPAGPGPQLPGDVPIG
jgi:hypothetical protein